MTTAKTVAIDVEAFELCARKNLETALHAVEIAALNELRGGLRRTELENAAASLREILRPNFGSYAN